MKYLVLWADKGTSGIKEEFGDWLDHRDIEINKELWDRIQSWRKEYETLDELTSQETKQYAVEAKRLDEHGILLAKEVAASSNDIKVKYFSDAFGTWSMT